MGYAKHVGYAKLHSLALHLTSVKLDVGATLLYSVAHVARYSVGWNGRLCPSLLTVSTIRVVGKL